jgi:ParB-like chromosome segregation protein Spo0J
MRPVHQIADLFPMMTDEELVDLAADIKANGLIHPIVVDKDGFLIDGRNRARACEIAGIEPTTVLFEGDDPRAYIIASNISRRHLTKGQQAMALAMIYPMPEKGGRGKKKTMDETSTLFSPKRLQLARTVLAHSPDLAQAVLAGSKSLDGAYGEARKAKQPLDAQVAGNVRRKVARSKKFAVLPGKGREIDALAKLPAAEQRSLAEAATRGEKVSAITAHSACDPKDPKTCDGTEEIELGKVIARLRRDQPRNADTMRICDALERRLRRP